jgi:hypothetical protein
MACQSLTFPAGVRGLLALDEVNDSGVFEELTCHDASPPSPKVTLTFPIRVSGLRTYRTIVAGQVSDLFGTKSLRQSPTNHKYM